MGNVFGNKIKISIFGESHGDALGVIIDGLPAGIEIDMDSIYFDLQRRKGGQDFTTARIESDTPNIVSGYFNNRTTGAPLCATFENNNAFPKDFSQMKSLLRPSHADYPAYVKFGGFNDYRGGGQFSGRLTLPLVFAGGICKQLLKKQNVNIYSHILQIKYVKDKDFRDFDFTKTSTFRYMVDPIRETKALELVEKARENGDSLGSIVQCGATGLKVGLGEPFFDSLESTISRLAFSIPAVKGIEFGKGFDFVNYLGSEIKDEYQIINDKIHTTSNNNGGIVGGMSTGEPVIFNVSIKPSASIQLEQNTVNIETMTNETLKISERHDSCISLRALPVIEAITAIAIYESWS